MTEGGITSYADGASALSLDGLAIVTDDGGELTISIPADSWLHRSALAKWDGATISTASALADFAAQARATLP